MYLTLKLTVKVVQDRMIVVSVVTRVEFDENKSSQNDKQQEHTVVGLRVCSLQVGSSTPCSHKKRPLAAISVKRVVRCRMQRERTAAGMRPRRQWHVLDSRDSWPFLTLREKPSIFHGNASGVANPQGSSFFR